MAKLFSVNIKWIDNGEECENYLISEHHDTKNLPYPYTDEDIFFYGISEESIKKAIKSEEPCENEWVITSLNKILEVTA